ncbi:MAG: conjugal transfer protein TraF [candidate division Zixibacteria bacterium]|nr:conjugal transfer protein TraF [candidate division Zixibacteria bacterium]
MKKLLLFLSVLLILQPVYTHAAFDDMRPSARARGMGNAFVGLADDATAIFYNPAGLSQLSLIQLYTTYQKPYGLDFLKYYGIAAAFPTSRLGTFAISGQQFGVDYRGVELETELTMSFGHGISLMNDVHSSLAFGYTVNYFQLKFAESVNGVAGSDQGTLGIDIGVFATIRNRTKVGFAVKNFNSPTFGDNLKKDLARRLAFGVSYEPYSGIITSGALEKKTGYDTRGLAGIEAEIFEFASLRLGLQSHPNNITAGLGLKYFGGIFDYALAYHNVLGATHQFAISYSFDSAFKKEAGTK